MAASSFALACDALARERDRVFLVRVSADYNIPFEELEAKYLVEAESAIKVPKKKGPRKAVVSVEDQPGKCQALTAKKGQCSFSALKGECFCKRHMKKDAEPKQDIPKPVKPPSKKAAAKVDPVHTHVVDSKIHADCALCQSHGNILAQKPVEEFEEAVEEAPPVMEMPADSEDEEDEESEESEGEGEGRGAAAESDFDEE